MSAARAAGAPLVVITAIGALGCGRSSAPPVSTGDEGTIVVTFDAAPLVDDGGADASSADAADATDATEAAGDGAADGDADAPSVTCPHPGASGGACPSYAGDVAPILHARCEACHGDASGQPLTSYPEVAKRLEYMEFAVRGCEMPPAERLANREADAILSWIACGAPDD